MVMLLVFGGTLVGLAGPAAAEADDTTPPELTELSFSPATVDTSGGPATITLTARITDNLSGYSGNGIIVFTSPSGRQQVGVNPSRISGTALDRTYEGTVTVPQFSEQGTWTLSGASLTDHVGNALNLTTPDLAAAGFPITFENGHTAPPTVSLIQGVAQAEGSDGGTTDFAFTIRLSAAAATAVSVQYYTADVEAMAPGDYVATTATTVTFAPGETTRTVHVPVVADTAPENDERFVVKLTHPSGATLGTATATGTIVNDDVLPTVSIDDVSKPEGSGGGTTPFTFTVALSAPSTQAVKVPYATADLEATAASDYTAVPTTTLIFAPGETSKTLTVLGGADNDPESNERFQVRLSPPTNATRAKGVGIATIVNDD